MQKLKKKGCEEYGKIFKNINTVYNANFYLYT